MSDMDHNNDGYINFGEYIDVYEKNKHDIDKQE